MSEQITWNDLNQLEQEAMGGDFPIEYRFKAEYWKTLETKGLVTTGRIDHNRGYVDITDAGKAIIPTEESEPSTDSDLAAQLAAAEKRIAELEAALTNTLKISREVVGGNTMRERYDKVLDQQARIMEIAIKALKATQS